MNRIYHQNHGQIIQGGTAQPQSLQQFDYDSNAVGAPGFNPHQIPPFLNSNGQPSTNPGYKNDVMNDSKVNTNLDHNQKIQPQQQQPNDPNMTLTEKFKAKKNWIIGITVTVVVIVIIAVVLGVVLSKKQPPGNTGYPINNDNNNETIFTCDQSPSECTGVSGTVRDYIFQSYNNSDQIRSLLQTSRSFNLVPTNTSSNLTRQNLTDIYKNISKSVQCLALNLPNNFSQEFQKLTDLQFTTEEAAAMYLKMTESFSGQPLKLVDSASLAQTCRFNLSTPSRRLLQQAPLVNNVTNTTNCTSNATSVLIYFSGIGYSPSAAIQNVVKMQEILSTNTSTNFDAGIIVLGAWRVDTQLGYFSNLLTSYQSYLLGKGYYVPTRYQSYSALRMILNLCRSNYCRPSYITSDAFLSLWRYYVQRTAYSFRYEQSYYEFNRHRDFVVQQINQGKKVVLLAHGQGSVYANQVYNMLNSTQKQSVKLVYVAPTVNTMEDGSTNYITNPSDTVISTIRTNAETNSSINVPLASNVAAATFDSQLDFGTNHELAGYANTYKQQLTSLIVAAKTAAVQPTRSMGFGPITITLTWDIQPDIDLHVLEPRGIHVYYGNKNGTSGHLDVDDTSSYGPQHYYTNCNPATGNYTVYLHFYSGNAPSTTITTISAGTQFYMKSATFNPRQILNIANISVTYSNSTSTYDYVIIPA